MGYILEIDTLIKLPEDIDISSLHENSVFVIEKKGERLLPLHKPVEFCNKDYTYIGKLEIQKLTLEKDKTTMVCKVLKLFSEEEAKIYSQNFIPNKKN